MPDYLNLSAYQVQQLREHGECQFMRAHPEDTPMPYDVGAEFGVRESIARPLKTDTAYHYLADGRVEDRFYYQNFHMPNAACRLQVELVASHFQYDNQGRWSYCLTLKLLTDATVLSD